MTAASVEKKPDRISPFRRTRVKTIQPTHRPTPIPVKRVCLKSYVSVRDVRFR